MIQSMYCEPKSGSKRAPSSASAIFVLASRKSHRQCMIQSFSHKIAISQIAQAGVIMYSSDGATVRSRF